MHRVDVLGVTSRLRQYRQDGKRFPHKPLLVLLALGNLVSTGSSRVTWSQAESQLADLITDFGPPSSTARAQTAAYPFTRLRSDAVWVLDRDVPMDAVRPLAAQHVSGRFTDDVETALVASPALLLAVARSLIESQFPASLAGDVLVAAGLDPELVLGGLATDFTGRRARSARWPRCSSRGTASARSAASTDSSARRQLASKRPISDGSTWAARTSRTTASHSARCTTSCSTVERSDCLSGTPSTSRRHMPPVHPLVVSSTRCTDAS